MKGQGITFVGRAKGFIPPEVGSKVRIRPLDTFHEYRKDEVKKFAGKVGKVISVDRGYQAPEIYTVLFGTKHMWFFEHEVESRQGGRSAGA